MLEQPRQSRKTNTVTKEIADTIRRHNDEIHLRAPCCGKRQALA